MNFLDQINAEINAAELALAELLPYKRLVALQNLRAAYTGETVRLPVYSPPPPASPKMKLRSAEALADMQRRAWERMNAGENKSARMVKAAFDALTRAGKPLRTEALIAAVIESGSELSSANHFTSLLSQSPLIVSLGRHTGWDIAPGVIPPETATE